MRTAGFFLLVLALGCGDPFHSPPSSDVVGAYDLESVNGEPLPYTASLGNVAVTVTASTLTLEIGGRAQLITRYADQPDPSVVNLRWHWDGSFAWFDDSETGDHLFAGTWEERRLTVSHGSPGLLPVGSYLYRRRG